MNKKNNIFFDGISISLLMLIFPFVISEAFAEGDWEKYRIKGYFYLPNGELDYQSQEIPYKITNGEIKKVKILDSGTKIQLRIIPYDDGVLELKIPRNVVDVNVGSIEDTFFVLHDGVEKQVIEKNPTQNDLVCFRHLEISFSKGTSNIEIVSFFLKNEPFRNSLGNFYSVDCLTEPSPKVQIKSGIQPQNVSCKDNLVLIFKPISNSPACVKSLTAEKLLGRGWNSIPTL